MIDSKSNTDLLDQRVQVEYIQRLFGDDYLKMLIELTRYFKGMDKYIWIVGKSILTRTTELWVARLSGSLLRVKVGM